MYVPDVPDYNLSLSPESSDLLRIFEAGLLALHIADAFPSRLVGQWQLDCQQLLLWITVAGTAPESCLNNSPIFPFNLLMIISAEEPQIRYKHKTVIE